MTQCSEHTRSPTSDAQAIDNVEAAVNGALTARESMVGVTVSTGEQPRPMGAVDLDGPGAGGRGEKSAVAARAATEHTRFWSKPLGGGSENFPAENSGRSILEVVQDAMIEQAGVDALMEGDGTGGGGLLPHTQFPPEPSGGSEKSFPAEFFGPALPGMLSSEREAYRALQDKTAAFIGAPVGWRSRCGTGEELGECVAADQGSALWDMRAPVATLPREDLVALIERQRRRIEALEHGERGMPAGWW